jgi:predicted amidohydrolase
LKKFLLLTLVVVGLWTIWSSIGRTTEWKEPNGYLDVVESITNDSVCSKNIVGIQPYMVPEDYLSEGHFYEKIKLYFGQAQQSGFFKENTVVLLPEYLCTWLVISGEKASVAETAHLNKAMTLMVLSNIPKFVRSYFYNNKEQDAFAASLFRMKAREMARIYSEVFKELASTYQVTINAGSIVLPDPSVNQNSIDVNVSGPLYNTSFIFYPDGSIDKKLIKKSFPISSEQPFVQACPITELPIYDLSIGKTAVLVCADSWYPQAYEEINKSGAEVILVNSYAAGDNAMNAPWKGYDGSTMPNDVDKNDIGTLKEVDAWKKYALPVRIQSTQAKIGVNVFLRGKLWDLGSDGQPFFSLNGELLNTSASDRGGIYNFCF